MPLPKSPRNKKRDFLQELNDAAEQQAPEFLQEINEPKHEVEVETEEDNGSRETFLKRIKGQFGLSE